MADKEQDLASLVAKIEQLEERQTITTKFLVRFKRQLNQLTDKLENLQRRVEPQQVVEPSLTNSPTPDEGISNNITNFSAEKFKVLRITQLLRLYGDMLLLEAYLAEDNSQEAPMTAQEFWRLYRNGQRDFTGINLAGADFGKNTTNDVNLSQANLSGAKLSGKWRGNNFSRANLSGANLCGVNLCGVNLHSANLKGADLSNADLSSAKLNEANLDDAYLHQAKLQFADLEKATLKKANLSKADLTLASLP